MTAVEWLVNILLHKVQLTEMEKLYIEDAKKMEKEQIMDAYWDGGQDVPMHVSTCEKYYNETFKSE